MNDKDENLNYQYPRYKKVREEFEIILVGNNFLIIKDKDENNLRVKISPESSLYHKGEKIYKEDGKFAWEKA